MAKKKNAPVLRVSGGGGDTPIPETPVITKSYAVRDKWLDKAKDNLVEFKSVDGEITDVKVNGEPAGGGGGDPETVQITIKNNSSHPIIFSTMLNVNGLRASYRIANNNTERGIRVVMFVPEMPFTFTTEDGGSISSTSTFGTVAFNSAYSGVITQGDTITITNA